MTDHSPQMISLMDNLLKRENLDLRLTPYRVLPTGEGSACGRYVNCTIAINTPYVNMVVRHDLPCVSRMDWIVVVYTEQHI